jgi:hypothetical protein
VGQVGSLERLVKLNHHTQDKGDKGAAYVIATLTSHGVKIALPLSEHLPFDLIAISPEGKLAKVSVKYRTARKGVVEVALKSKWDARRGTKSKRWERGAVDGHAIYCPETETCYFVADRDLTTSTITLRIKDPGRKAANIRLAADYTDPMVMFDGS